MVAFVQILLFDVNAQHHLSAATGGELVLDEFQIPCNQRKKIAGLAIGKEGRIFRDNSLLN